MIVLPLHAQLGRIVGSRDRAKQTRIRLVADSGHTPLVAVLNYTPQDECQLNTVTWDAWRSRTCVSVFDEPPLHECCDRVAAACIVF